MDGRDPNRSMNKPKTSYFQKYRRQLDKISEQMKKHDKMQTSFINTAPEVKDQSVTFNNISFETKPTAIANEQSLSSKTSIKNIVTKKEKQIFISAEPKQASQKSGKETEALRQVDLLVADLQVLKGKIIKTQLQVQERRKVVQNLKKRLSAGLTEKQYMDNVVNYAEKILSIELTMKAKKQQHEDQLNKLVMEKNDKHSQNVELSKDIDICQEDIQKLENQLHTLQLQSPTKNMEIKANKLKADISRLQHEYDLAKQKANSNEELKEMSYRQYTKYIQIFTRKFLGRQIALTQDRIKLRNDNKRYLVQMQKKRLLLKERKIQMLLRKKAVLEANRVIDSINKEIKQTQSQQKVLQPADRKLSIFQKL